MKVEIRPAEIDILREYGKLPIAFKVRSVLRPTLIQEGMGGIELREEELPKPYTKDYDALPGGPPVTWLQRFNMDNWVVLVIPAESGYVAGAVVAFDTPGLNMLEGRQDVAVLWDIRVQPEVRRGGIGSMLFSQVLEWSREHGCVKLKAETQNTNVPACKFYAKQGCELRTIDLFAYENSLEVAHEAMLIWEKTLG
jgi:GNAT superfamily N-acetyltransferase